MVVSGVKVTPVQRIARPSDDRRLRARDAHAVVVKRALREDTTA